MKNFCLAIAAVFLSILTLAAQDNVAVLKGKVIDSADGYPLIGVSVMVEGTKFGTITDVDGLYELRIPDQKCEVTFSYVGYDDEIRIYNLKNASSFAKIVMYMNTTQLADVVVTGVYERKKEDTRAANFICLTIALRPLLRVGERFSPRPISSIK